MTCARSPTSTAGAWAAAVPGVTRAAPLVRGQVMANMRSRNTGVEVYGISPANLATLPGIGFVVADNLFARGVPYDIPIQTNGNVAQVACRHCPVMRQDIGNRLFATLDALEEVLHMSFIAKLHHDFAEPAERRPC